MTPFFLNMCVFREHLVNLCVFRGNLVNYLENLQILPLGNVRLFRRIHKNGAPFLKTFVFFAEINIFAGLPRYHGDLRVSHSPVGKCRQAKVGDLVGVIFSLRSYCSVILRMPILFFSTFLTAINYFSMFWLRVA